MRWLIRYSPLALKVLAFVGWLIGFGATVRTWAMGAPLEYVAILFVAAIGVAAFATLGLFHLGDYLQQRSEESEEGERVAKILEGIKLSGTAEIDAQTLVGIWFADQPANKSLRLAIKTAMYARLREAVRLEWLRCPNFPAHEVRRNFLISLEDAIRFFRARRWLEINPEQ